MSLKKTTLLLSGLLAVAFTSCKDDEYVAPEPVPVGFVSFYNGSSGSQPFDILLDNQRINNQGFKYTDYSNYLNLVPGDRKIKITPINAVNALIDTTIKVQDKKAYSLFIASAQQKTTLLAVQDSILTPAAGKAVVRVVNLSPDAPAVDITTSGTSSQALSSGLAFKKITPFVELPAGTHSLQIKGNGEGAELLPKSEITLESGRAYTLIVRGTVAAPTGDAAALSAQLIKNY